MNKREPWLGLASASGLIIMLLGDGLADIAGLLIAAAPLAYGVAAVLARWNAMRGEAGNDTRHHQRQRGDLQ